MNLYKTISDAIKEKLAKIPAFAAADLSAIAIESPKNRDFGDFATNAAMTLARPLKQNPRVIADVILSAIAGLPFVADASIAGPGFINIKLKDEFILKSANSIFPISKTKSPLVIDLDYGGYNIAKALHIGHLRGTVIGDTFNRIAKYLGHKTKTYNYIGDWGRPMGLIIAWIMEHGMPKTAEELNKIYPISTARAKDDEAWLEHARKVTADFQSGNPEYMKIYDWFMKVSLDDMDSTLKRLNVLPFDSIAAERNASLYTGAVEKILHKHGMLIESEGAMIIPVKNDSDTAPMPPLIWRTGAGAQTYDASDVATIYYRDQTDRPDQMIYIIDTRQQLRFQQIFRIAKKAELTNAQLFHSWFGAVTGKDGSPLKTRDGGVAFLSDIVDETEAVVRARVAESGKILPEETIKMIALAALKFNDLMHDIKSDYAFDPAAVTQFEGHTGPYILYTAVRLNSVLKKAGFEMSVNCSPLGGSRNCEAVSVGGQNTDIPPTGSMLRISPTPPKGGVVAPSLQPEERELLLTVLDFERTLNVAFDRRATDILANYTYDLCQAANAFYHNCPILRDDVNAETRSGRLNIVRMTIATLSTAIDLMGLKIPDEM
ncbi:MAG: arginine--tRNA ligase [Proteobacteria bacterium]|nr:arginine--tRNA ligase [Pseudomonadota bacterium]